MGITEILRSRSTMDVTEKIKEYMKPFDLNEDDFKKFSVKLLEEMVKGLGKDTNSSSSMKMLPTYVRSLPNGSEDGSYLALDLGGTNFRVLLVTLKGQEVEMKNEIFPISDETMKGSGTALFDHIAKCISDFMNEHKLNEEELHLGFTFSFPCKQEGLAVGRLITWTKGFTCEGVEGEDVVKLLDEAIERRGDIKVKCVAILNDTVGCLMSCAFHDHNCRIGVILGTGTNACYMEKLEHVDIWDEDKDEPSQVIINTEWGAFGDNGGLKSFRTEVDEEVDRLSLNPGKQLYEKMISGMFMGEIARQCIVKCIKAGHLCNGNLTKMMDTYQKFYSKYISEIEEDGEEKGYKKTSAVMEEMGYENLPMDDLRDIHYICHLVGKRAAYLSAAGIATLLNRINQPNVTVAVDGSLYRFHPLFHDLMEEKINAMLNPGLKFHLMLSEDGSGKGAALVAAVSSRLKKENL